MNANPPRRPRKVWSPSDIAEIRRRWRCGFTYAEIADHFGVSRQSVALAVRRHKIVSPDEARTRVAEGLRGRSKSEKHKKALSKAGRKAWTKARRRAQAETMKAHRATAEGKAELQQMLQTVARNKRGFDVPDQLRDEYRFLRRQKNIPARDVGAILGLVTS